MADGAWAGLCKQGLQAMLLLLVLLPFRLFMATPAPLPIRPLTALSWMSRRTCLAACPS